MAAGLKQPAEKRRSGVHLQSWIARSLRDLLVARAKADGTTQRKVIEAALTQYLAPEGAPTNGRQGSSP